MTEEQMTRIIAPVKNHNVISAAKKLSSELRKNPTRSEKIFWAEVRNRKVLGKKFLRQYPIFFLYVNKQRFFVADFYCHEQRIVVEIDGKSHDYQKEYDDLRTHLINNLDVNVVRFKNEEIEKDVHQVSDRLKKEQTHPKSLS